MTIIYFILILGTTIFIHEFGHFLFAKKAKVHVYEFALGMGPRIFKFNRKNDETIYSLRLFPIGGFVSMAGEGDTDEKEVKEKDKLYNKTWIQRFKIIIAGIVFNFILSIVLLFFLGIYTGAETGNIYINTVSEEYTNKLYKNDLIISVNDHKVKSSESLSLYMQTSDNETISMEVKHADGTIEVVDVGKVKMVVEDDGETIEKEVYPFSITVEAKKGLWVSIKYAFAKFFELIEQMVLIIWYLITGKLALNNLSGPVGIFSIVKEASAYGFSYIVYLLALISVNVGFINLLPIPAFDGGRLLFLIIEKIKGKPVSSKFENITHAVGFVLLMILMVLITYNDIIKLFN